MLTRKQVSKPSDLQRQTEAGLRESLCLLGSDVGGHGGGRRWTAMKVQLDWALFLKVLGKARRPGA